MTTKSIFIGPHPNGVHFFRADHDGGRWFIHPNFVPFHVILPPIVTILAAEDAPDLTISSFRGESLLDLAPDDFDLAESATTEILCSIGEISALQIWCPLAWHAPTRDPVAGERFTRKELPSIIKSRFPKSRMEELEAPGLAPKREIWTRSAWLGVEVAPNCFVPSRMDLTLQEHAEADRQRLEASQQAAHLSRVKAASTNSAAASAANKAASVAYSEAETARRARAAKTKVK